MHVETFDEEKKIVTSLLIAIDVISKVRKLLSINVHERRIVESAKCSFQIEGGRVINSKNVTCLKLEGRISSVFHLFQLNATTVH